MITSTTPRIERSTTWRRARRRGFTLAEIMIGASLGSIILAGVMSTFLVLSSSGAAIYAYNGMELEGRRAFEVFGEDARMASAVTWNSSSSVTLTVPDYYAANSNQVTYAYDSATTGPTAQCFYLVPGASAAGANKRILVRNVTSMSFARYDRLNAAATTDLATKRLELSLRIATTIATRASATESAVSAAFVLRNKLAN